METLVKVKLDLDPSENPLKQIRQALNMSQDEFAQRIGAHRRTIIRWENGQTIPAFTIPQIKALQKELSKVGLDFQDLPDTFN